MKQIFTLTFALLAHLGFSQDIETGLLAHYRFNGSAENVIGTGEDGQVIGAIPSTDRADNEDGAYFFDGGDDYISVSNNTNLKPDFPFSLSLWFYIEAFGETSSVIYASDASDDVYSGFWLGYVPAGTISAGYGSNVGQGGSHRVTRSSDIAIETQTWYHVTAVFHGEFDIDLWIGCDPIGGGYSGSGSGMVYTDAPTTIGRSTGHAFDAYHEGKIDDIRLFNRALAPEDINRLCTEEGSVTSVGEHHADNNMTVYPNPSNGRFHFNSDLPCDEVNIFAPTGELVYQMKPTTTELDLRSLAKGVYILVAHGGGWKKTSRLVIE
jgi:hypothetical protein